MDAGRPYFISKMRFRILLPNAAAAHFVVSPLLTKGGRAGEWAPGFKGEVVLCAARSQLLRCLTRQNAALTVCIYNIGVRNSGAAYHPLCLV